MMRALLLLTIGLMTATGGPSSQLGYAWSYEELAAKSDVVAIVAFVSARDTGVKTALDELRPPLPVLEVNTAFRVLSTLKGSVDKTIEVRHYRIEPERLVGGCINCGVQLDFASMAKAAGCRVEDLATLTLGRCSYMVFLKRDADSKYSFTSGRVSPRDSVFSLKGPS